MHKDLLMLKKIQRMVERYLFPSSYDTEDIAVKIYIELLEKNLFASRLLIHNRCIDEIRRGQKVKFCPLEHFINVEASREDENALNAKELINVLMEQSMFSPQEKMLIYRAFYKEEKVSQKELDVLLEKLRKELKLLLNAKGM